jgi:hypothetical protein
MKEISERHRRWVAHFVSGKIKEMRYYLSVIVAACDQSLRLFSGGQQVPPENNHAVVFGFSAFANTVQTLKDAVYTVTGERLAWSKFKQIRHGTFMRHARNAATHDGNPVISAWVDGRYFASGRIVRLDESGKVLEVDAPGEDVRTMCLEFTRDFCGLLRESFSRSVGAPPLAGASFNVRELEEAIAESKVVPDFARQLFASNRDEIARSLAAATHDPVANALSELEGAVCFCDAALGN